MFKRETEAGTDEDAARKRKVVLGGLVGVALLLLLGVVFVLPSLASSGDNTSGLVVTHPAAKPKAAATPTPSASPTPDAVPSLSAGGVRDPFAKLPQEVAAAAAATTASTPSTALSSAAGSTSAAAGTTPGGTTPGTTVTPSISPSPAGSTTSSGTTGSSTRTASVAAVTDNTPSTGSAVQVVAVRGSTADIQIDNKPFTVTAGSSATAGYSVVSVGNGSVVIRHAGVNHTLMEGELQTF